MKKAVYARLNKDDEDINIFLEKQSNKNFTIKFCIRCIIRKFGNKDLSFLQKEIKTKGLKSVIEDL